VSDVDPKLSSAKAVIAEQVVQRTASLAHRHPLTAGVVVLDHRARAGVWQTAPNIVHSKWFAALFILLA